MGSGSSARAGRVGQELPESGQAVVTGPVVSDGHGGHEGQVVHPAHLQREVHEADVEEQAEQELRDGDLVAQADGLERGLAGEGPADRGHGVGEVQDPGVGTQLLDVAGDVEEDRDVAQGADDASGSHGVADRLAHAEAVRDLEVVSHRREATGRDVHHHEVGVAQRVTTIGRGASGKRDAAHVGEVLRELDHARQRRVIDVVQHDLRVAHNGGVDEVDEQLRRPLVAAAADDRDARGRWCVHRSTPYAAGRTAHVAP